MPYFIYIGRPIEGEPPTLTGTIWYADVLGVIFELSPVDFSIIRSSIDLTSGSLLSVGGMSDVIYTAISIGALAFVQRRSTVDFSLIQFASSPSTTPNGIGGTTSVIWHSDNSSTLIYELSTVDFSVIRSAASPSNRPEGIGGDENAIWHCDFILGLIYELSVVNFDVVRSRIAPDTTPRGIGGTEDVIWHCNPSTDLIYELSTNDLSAIRSAAAPSNFGLGIGGE